MKQENSLGHCDCDKRHCPTHCWSMTFTTYAEHIYHYLLKRLEDEQDAQDCLQDTFLRLFKSINSYNTDQPIAPYLFTIAKNVANDLLRSRYKRSATSEVESTSLSYINELESIELDILINEVSEQANLTPFEKLLITLTATFSLKPRDIAKLTDKSEKCIRQHLWKARKKIRNNAKIHNLLK